MIIGVRDGYIITLKEKAHQLAQTATPRTKLGKRRPIATAHVILAQVI
jgi:hypothetical protein